MKLIQILLVLFLVLFLFPSCSTNKGEKSADGTEIADGDDDGDFMLDDEDEEDEVDLIVEDDGVIEEEEKEEESTDDIAATEEEEEEEEEAIEKEPIRVTGNNGKYTIQKHDTLMLIAFKLYGDYSQWRKIAAANGGMSSYSLSVGDVIKYPEPEVRFVWNPKGSPFMIRRGDTLALISSEVYGLTRRWREIYNNNRDMIKNPNLIFAGFTLYYVPDRNLASE